MNWPNTVAYLEGCSGCSSTHRFLDMGAEHPSILSKISLNVGTKKEILLISTYTIFLMKGFECFFPLFRHVKFFVISKKNVKN